MFVTAHRSSTTTGAALLGAGLIATSVIGTSIAPVQMSAPRLSEAAVALQASVFDIFTFPAWRQAIANEVEFVAIRAVGFAESSAGLAESVAALPQTLVTTAQQVFTGDLLGALTTLEDAAVGAAAATLVPLVLANIAVGQIQLAIQSALLLAQPTAAVEFASGLFTALDTVTRAVITAGQNFVDAVLSLNPVAIAQSVVTGVVDVVASLGTAGQATVDGTVAAQNTLATALATRPATPVAAAVSTATDADAAAEAGISDGAVSGALETSRTVGAPPPARQSGGVADVRASSADESPRRATVRASERGTAGVTTASAAVKETATTRSARGPAA